MLLCFFRNRVLCFFLSRCPRCAASPPIRATAAGSCHTIVGSTPHHWIHVRLGLVTGRAGRRRVPSSPSSAWRPARLWSATAEPPSKTSRSHVRPTAGPTPEHRRRAVLDALCSASPCCPEPSPLSSFHCQISSSSLQIPSLRATAGSIQLPPSPRHLDPRQTS